MRETTILERRWDEAYLEKSPAGFTHRKVVRLFRSHIIKVICTVVLRTYERGQIEKEQMHAILGTADRMLYPSK
jgi:hypothetical protein